MFENTLKQRLFEHYGGFADKRIKNLAKGNHFFCDERARASSRDARGALFYWFCTVGMTVESPDLVHMHIGKVLPRKSAGRPMAAREHQPQQIWHSGNSCRERRAGKAAHIGFAYCGHCREALTGEALQIRVSSSGCGSSGRKGCARQRMGITAKRRHQGAFPLDRGIRGYLMLTNGMVEPGTKLVGSLPSQRSAFVSSTRFGDCCRASDFALMAEASASPWRRMPSARALAIAS